MDSGSIHIDFGNLPIAQETVNEQLSKYSENEAKIRLEKLDNIFIQHLGDKWRLIIFLIILFLFGVIALLAYDFEKIYFLPYYRYVSIFLMVFIISITFFSIWRLILPEKFSVKYGIVPYPENHPYIPPDNTKCGSTPVVCTSQSECDTKCVDKNGNDNYQCTSIGDKEVYYLGTKLSKNKSFCLPKEGAEKMQNCGTHTGRFVWSKDDNGNQSWTCKCLYPEMYGGDTCTDPLLNGTLCTNQSVCWDPNNMPISLINTSPYDSSLQLKCNDNYTFYGGNCHEDKCYSGNTSQSVNAYFDVSKMSCVCGDNVVQSNISGYCYSYDNLSECKPHPITKKCQYDLQLTGSNGSSVTSTFFKLNGVCYLSYLVIPSTGLQYNVLVDVTSVTSETIKQKLIEMSTTSIGIDAFYAFPKMKLSDFSDTEQAKILSIITNSTFTYDNNGLSSIFSNKLYSTNNNTTAFGVAKLCKSYFYDPQRDDPTKTFPLCDNMLSKTGSDYVQFCTTNLAQDCGLDFLTNEACSFDLSSGKNCNCPTSGNAKVVDKKCLACLPKNQYIATKDEENQCCSGKSESVFDPNDPGADPGSLGYQCL